MQKFDLRDFECDVRYSKNKNDYLIINGDCYTKNDALILSLQMINAGTEILQLLESEISTSLKCV